MQYLIWKILLIVKTYLEGKRKAVVLHRKDLIWKLPVLLHMEPRLYLIMACSVDKDLSVEILQSVR